MDIFQIWQEILGWNDHSYMQSHFGNASGGEEAAAPASTGTQSLLDYAGGVDNNAIAMANSGHQSTEHGPANTGSGGTGGGYAGFGGGRNYATGQGSGISMGGFAGSSHTSSSLGNTDAITSGEVAENIRERFQEVATGLGEDK